MSPLLQRRKLLRTVHAMLTGARWRRRCTAGCWRRSGGGAAKACRAMHGGGGRRHECMLQCRRRRQNTALARQPGYGGANGGGVGRVRVMHGGSGHGACGVGKDRAGASRLRVTAHSMQSVDGGGGKCTSGARGYGARRRRLVSRQGLICRRGRRHAWVMVRRAWCTGVMLRRCGGERRVMSGRRRRCDMYASAAAGAVMQRTARRAGACGASARRRRDSRQRSARECARRRRVGAHAAYGVKVAATMGWCLVSVMLVSMYVCTGRRAHG